MCDVYSYRCYLTPGHLEGTHAGVFPLSVIVPILWWLLEMLLPAKQIKKTMNFHLNDAYFSCIFKNYVGHRVSPYLENLQWVTLTLL